MFLSLFKTSMTIVIVLVLVLIYFVQNRLVNRYQDTLKKGLLYLTYVILFLLFSFAIIGILWIWDYDFGTLTTNFTTSLVTIVGDNVGKLIASGFTLFVGIMITKITKLALLKVGEKQGTLQKRKKTIAKVSTSVVKYLVYVLIVIIILAIWGVNVMPAIAGLGIAGIVIGLGAQKFINDLISGFFIIFEHHFDVGDIIDVGGFKGEVIDIGLKTTKIRSWKGEVKILANGDIDNLTNYSRNPSIGIVDFGIAYAEDVQKTINLLTTELPKLREVYPNMLEDPQVVGVTELANSSVNLRVIVKTVTETHYAIERGMRQKIKEILDQNHIEIPFPQVVVHQDK